MAAGGGAVLREFFRQTEQQLKTGNSDLASILHHDFAMHFPRTTSAAPIFGAAALQQFFNDTVAAIYDCETLEFTFHFFLEDREYAHTRYTLGCRMRGGETYHNEYLATARIEEGKIRELWEFFDTAYLYQLMGK